LRGQDGLADPPAQDVLEQALVLAVRVVKLHGQTEGELRETMIEERVATLERHRHRCPIHLGQHIVTQERVVVRAHHLGCTRRPVGS
jgi:hypothetical protein